MATYKQILNINESSGRVREFKDLGEKQEKARNKVLKTIEWSDKAKLNFQKNINNRIKINIGMKNVNDVFGGVDGKRTLDKISLLSEVSANNGNVYFFDTETIGGLLDQNGVGTLDKISSKNLIMTEFSLQKQRFSEVNKITHENYFSSTLEEGGLKELINNTKNQMSPTTKSTVERLAGYDIKNGAEYGTKNINGKEVKYISRFGTNTPSGSIIDAAMDGAKSLDAGAQFVRGTVEYNKALREIFDKFESIANEKNAMITGMNIEGFDYKVLNQVFKDSIENSKGQSAWEGINSDIVDRVMEEIDMRSYDMQKMSNVLIRGQLTRDQNTVRQKYLDKKQSFLDELESGNVTEGRRKIINEEVSKLDEIIGSIKNDITLQNTARGMEVSGLIADMNNGDTAHIAPVDVKSNIQAFNHYKDALIKAGEEATESGIIDDSKMLFFNNSMEIDADRLFTVSEKYSVTNFNPYPLERGHGYGLKTYTIGKEVKEYAGTNVLEFSDLADNGKKISIFLNDGETAEDFLLGANTTILDRTNKNIDALRSTVKAQKIENAAMSLENFRKINSDEGFATFNTFFDDYKKLNENFTDLKPKDIRKILNNTKDVNSMELSNKLASKQENKVIQQNVTKLTNLYTDFTDNYEIYDRIQKAIIGTIGIDNTALKANNNPISRNATKMFNNYLGNIGTALMDNASEEEILDYIIKDTNFTSTDEYTTYFNKNRLKDKSKKTPSHLEAKKDFYKHVFGEDFNKNSKMVERLAFGSKKANYSLKDLYTLDLIGVNGEYSRVQASDTKTLQSRIKQKVYALGKENVNAIGKTKVRETFLNEMIADLYGRKVLSGNSFNEISKMNTIESKIQFLSDSVIKDRKAVFKAFENKERDIISIMNGESRSSIERVGDFITNLHSKDVMERPISNTFLGKSFEESLEKLPQNVRDNALSIERIGTLSTNSKNLPKDDIKKILIDNNNWNESYADDFIKKVIESDTIQDTNISTKIFADSDGKTMMAIMNRRNERSFEDAMAKGVGLDDLKLNAAIVELPKISETSGIKYIQRGNVNKVINNKIFYSKSDSRGKSLRTLDTVEEFIENLKYKLNPYNRDGKNRYKTMVDLIQGREFERANSSINNAWKNLNETKTLLGSGYISRIEDGKLVFKKKFIATKADVAISTMDDVGGLLGVLDEVFKGSDELKASYAEVAKEGHEKFVDWITKNNAKSFGGDNPVDAKRKLWFQENIEKIAKEIANNEAIGINDNETKRILETLQKIGARGFLNGENTEAEYSLFNETHIGLVDPYNSHDNAGRPLSTQISKAKMLEKESVEALFEGRAPEEMKALVRGGKSVEDVVGFKFGSAIETETMSDMLIDANKKLNIYDGIMAKTRIINPFEMKEEVQRFLTSQDEIQKIAKSIANNYNINASNDEIIKAMNKIWDSSGLYEDSGVVSDIIGEIVNPGSIKSIKTSRPDLLVGKKFINEGDVIDVIDGKNIKHKGQILKINNISGNDIITELKEGPSSTKIGIYNEKLTAMHSSGGSKKGSLIQHTILTEFFGAPVLFNPSLEKHLSMGNVVGQYINTIRDSITNDREMSYVNNILSEMGEQLFYVEKDSRGMYVFKNTEISRGTEDGILGAIKRGEELTDDIVKGYDVPKILSGKFEKMISTDAEDLQGFKNRLAKGFGDIKDKRISTSDIKIMQDNQIHNVDKSKVTQRQLNVFGTTTGDVVDDIADFMDADGNFKFGAVKKHLEDLIINDPKAISAKKQYANILDSLSLAKDGKALRENVIIKEINLEDIVTKAGKLNAKNIPEAFGMVDDGPNVFKVNLGREINVGFGKTDSLYLANVNPNSVEDSYYLTKQNRIAADLFNDMASYNEGTLKGVGLEGAAEHFDGLAVEYYNESIDEIVKKKGILKRAQEATLPNSVRNKASMIVPPVYDKNGFIEYAKYTGMDKYTNISGKIAKQNFAVLNVKDALGNPLMSDTALDKRLASIGEDLLTRDISRDTKFLNILNDVGGTKYSLEDIALARNNALKVAKSSGIDRSMLSNIGERYLSEVGVLGIQGRAPAVYAESDQVVNMFARRDSRQGVVVTYNQGMKAMHGDADGDEIVSAFLNWNSDDVKGFKLRNYDDEISVSLRNVRDAESSKYLRGAIDSLNKPARTTQNTLEDSLKWSYAQSHTAYTMAKELASKNMKATVGQLSNLDNMLVIMTNAYADNKNLTMEARGRLFKSVNIIGSNLEQASISLKNVKGRAEALNISNNSSKLAKSIEKLTLPAIKGGNYGANANNEKIVNGIVDFLRASDNLVGSELAGESIKGLTEDAVVERGANIFKALMNNDISLIPTVEGKLTADEAILDMLTVAQSDVAQAIKNNTNIRNTMPYELDTLGERIDHVIDSSKPENLDIMAERITKNISTEKVKTNSKKFIEGVNATEGDFIVNNSKKISESGGIYKILGYSKGDNGIDIDVEDILTRVDNGDGSTSSRKITLRGDNPNDANAAINGYGVVDTSNKKDLKNTIKDVTKKEVSKNYKRTKYNYKEIKKTMIRNLKLNTEADKQFLSSISRSMGEDLTFLMDIGEYLEYSNSLTRKETTGLINGMINRIKENEKTGYRQALREEILNTSLAKKHSLTKANVNSFVTNKIEANFDQIRELKKMKHFNFAFNNATRIDESGLLHNLTDSTTSTAERSAINQYIAGTNSIHGKRMSTMIETGLSNGFLDTDSFKTEVLGWSPNKTLDMINNNNLDDAANAISRAVVPGGKYAGYQFSEVGLLDDFEETMKTFRSNSKYKDFFATIDLKSNLSDKNREIVYGHGAWSSSVSDADGLNSKMSKDITKIRKDINDKIKEKGNAKGSARKSSENAIKDNVDDVAKNIKNVVSGDKATKKMGISILEKASEVFNSKNDKTKLIGIAALAAASVLGLSYVNGGTINENDREKAKATGFNNADTSTTGDIKTSNNVSQDSSYSRVPISDTSHYQKESVGLNVNVRGRGYSRSANINSLLSDLGNNSKVNINTSYRDSRRRISNNDVNETISNSLNY